jgi:hypothetical protein
MDVNFEMALLELQRKTFLKDHQERMEIVTEFLRECDDASRKCEEASKIQEENDASLDELLNGF